MQEITESHCRRIGRERRGSSSSLTRKQERKQPMTVETDLSRILSTDLRREANEGFSNGIWMIW